MKIVNKKTGIEEKAPEWSMGFYVSANTHEVVLISAEDGYSCIPQSDLMAIRDQPATDQINYGKQVRYACSNGNIQPKKLSIEEEMKMEASDKLDYNR